MGVAYGVLKRPEKAMVYFTRALELLGENASVFYNMGLAYMIVEQYEEAVPYLVKADELAPVMREP